MEFGYSLAPRPRSCAAYMKIPETILYLCLPCVEELKVLHWATAKWLEEKEIDEFFDDCPVLPMPPSKLSKAERLKMYAAALDGDVRLEIGPFGPQFAAKETKMLIMSFAHTTEALLAGRKTVTRRCWKDTHAAKFTPGTLVAAWDHLPHRKFAGSPNRKPRRIATIRIVSVRYERIDAITDDDVAREGFPSKDAKWFIERFRSIVGKRKTSPTHCYRVEFEVVDKGEGEDNE